MRFFNLNLWFNSLASHAVQVFEYFVDNFCFYLGPVQIPVGVKVLREFEHLFGLWTFADAFGFDLDRVRSFIRVKGASEFQFLEIF